MFKSRWSKVLGAMSISLALAGFAGCNKPSVDSEADVAPAEAEIAQGEHAFHAPGPAMLLGAAMHELTLSDAQKATIQGEMDALHADMGQHKDAHEAARTALAAAVRSGKVDEAALLQQFAKEPVESARVAKALKVLHDTLTAEQRKELVDAVAAKMEKHEGRGEHGARGKHERGEGKGREAHEGKDGEMGPMGHLLRGLDLSDAQRQTLRDAMQKNMPSEADRDAMKAQHEAFGKGMRDRLQSFAADSFDANAFATPPDGAKGGPKAMFGRMVKMLATVTPILNETQRETLAKRLEEAPMGRPHGEK